MSRRKIRTSYQKVCRRLSVRGLVSHLDEVLPRLIRRTKVRHFALVNYTHLVEQLVQALAGLVDGHDGRHPHGVRGDTKCLDKLESSRSTIIHGQYTSSNRQEWGDRLGYSL
jgi:hypothetical protein